MTKILIVDDSRFIAALIKDSFQDYDVDFVHAENGAKGLEAVEDAGPDLLLVDLNMPVMDGHEMLRALEKRERPIPVIMLTSSNDSDSIISTVKRGGVSAFLPKPLEPQKLVDTVAAVLRKNGGEALALKGEPSTDKHKLIDILIVDKLEKVSTRLRQLVPDELSIEPCRDFEEAINVCETHVFRAILIDCCDSPITREQVTKLRELGGNAAIVALVFINADRDGVEENGFDRVIGKPFQKHEISQLLQEVLMTEKGGVTVDGNVVHACSAEECDNVKAFPEESQKEWFAARVKLLEHSISDFARACEEQVVVDLLSASDISCEMTVRMTKPLVLHSQALRLSMHLVVSASVAKEIEADAKKKKAVSIFKTVKAAVADIAASKRAP